MDFVIHMGGEIIARFLYEQDRDACMDTLKEMYPDCMFTKG